MGAGVYLLDSLSRGALRAVKVHVAPDDSAPAVADERPEQRFGLRFPSELCERQTLPIAVVSFFGIHLRRLAVVFLRLGGVARRLPHAGNHCVYLGVARSAGVVEKYLVVFGILESFLHQSRGAGVVALSGLRNARRQNGVHIYVVEISHALARREIAVAQQSEHPVAVPDIRARHDLRCERIIAFDACGMVLFEEFVARADIFAAGLENLVALFEKNRLRIERDSLAVILRGFPIILKMLPIRPPEVSPNHREFRIEPGAFFPLGDRPLRNLVVKEIAEIVMNLPVVGNDAVHLFEDARGLEPERVGERAVQRLPEIFFRAGFVARLVRQISEPHFCRGISGLRVYVFQKFCGVRGKSAPLVGERKLYVRFRLVAHQPFKVPAAGEDTLFASSEGVYRIERERLFGGFEGRTFFALGAENGGFKVERWNVAGVVRQSLVEPLDGGVEISARGINLRKLRVGRGVAGVAPKRAVKHVDRLVRPSEGGEDEPEIVHGLAVLRASVVFGLPRYGGPQVFFRPF